MWLARFLCTLSLVALSGLDRVAVQTYAWATMLHDRAPEIGFTEALDSTFSGEEPCEICNAIAEVTQEEQHKAPSDRSAEDLPKLYSPSAQRSAALLHQEGMSKRIAEFTEIHHDLCTLEITTPPPEFG